MSKEMIFTREHPQPQFIESPLLKVLERIAVAFEEQNRMNQEWIDLQVKWREAGDPVGKRIIELHEENARRDEQWRDERALKMDEIFRITYEAYTEFLTEQVKLSQKAEVSDDHTE